MKGRQHISLLDPAHVTQDCPASPNVSPKRKLAITRTRKVPVNHAFCRHERPKTQFATMFVLPYTEFINAMLYADAVSCQPT